MSLVMARRSPSGAMRRVPSGPSGGTDPAQGAADRSPAVTALARLADLADNGAAQRKLAGSVGQITDTYLSRFAERFGALSKFHARRAVLAHLKASDDTLSSDEDLIRAIPDALTALSLPADPAPKAVSGVPSPSPREKGPIKPSKGASPDRPPEPQILSTAPSRAVPARSLSPAVDIAPAEEDTPASLRVKAIYEAGLLLVTAVQRKDLDKMHRASAQEGVAAHAVGGRIAMAPEDVNEGGALAHAKVNWTLTSPAMKPHYFKMIVSDEDRGPKPDTGNAITAPRVATLADPNAMGARFMRGKEGRADFSEWEQDQSSGKTAGVQNDAPLSSYSDRAVSDRFAAIKAQQETEYRDTNPEINTFGFPPDAIVGFLVTSGNEADMEAVRAAKAAMSQQQRARSFPVMCWKADPNTANRWQLVTLAHV